MSEIFVAGLGSVSPAGWTVGALRQALEEGVPLPFQSLERPGWEKPARARLVPELSPRPAYLGHPRLRRSSSITHYTASVALEALSALRPAPEPNARLGLVMCVQSGCVHYSCRFFAEVLSDPSTASPLVFPETVYAAPASHVSALLGNVSLACSLVGDPGAYLEGLALGAHWLQDGLVDLCLVIGAEEANWILADALWHLQRPGAISAGAGALCLCRDPQRSIGVRLAAVTDAHTYTARENRAEAARAMRGQLREKLSGELLCDGLGTSPRTDAAETSAWSDWTGPRLSPKRVLGEGLMAAAAWQCVAACDAVARAFAPAATVSLVGSNQQAIGARFVRVAANATSHLPDAPPGRTLPA